MVFQEFACLQLVQVIYQHDSRFVLSSGVDLDLDSWTLELGQVGAGRWWSGNLTSTDILGFTGGLKSARILSQFAAKLASTIKKGELSIAKWSDRDEGQVTLELDPTGKSPIRIPLKELEGPDATAKPLELLFEFFTRASEQHECQLFRTAKAEEEALKTAATEKAARKLEDLQSTNNRLQSQLSEIQSSAMAQARPSVVRPPKRQAGASLGNPTKKARRVQELEFED